MPTKKDVQFDKEAVLITLDQVQQALEVLGTTINRLQRYVKKYGPEFESGKNLKTCSSLSEEVKQAKQVH